MSMVGFPLLLIPLAIYNIIAFLMRDVSFAAPLFTLPLTSGTAWPVTLSDMLLALGILLLLLEVIKGARPGAKFLMDHLLSLLVFCGAAAEFVLLPQFGTSTYFLLALLALVDFLSGIALRARRGTGDVGGPGLRTSRPNTRRRARTPVRSGACAIGAGSGFGRRIRAAGSPRAENRACRRHAGRPIAGGAIARPAAGQQRVPVAGAAAALISAV